MANAFNVAMGRVVRQLRKSSALTQKEVGAHINVSYQQLNKYENGTNGIAACYLPRLAELFGVSVADLYAQVGLTAAATEPTEAENDSFLAARYVARISDPKLRRVIVDFTRKLAYQGGEAA